MLLIYYWIDIELFQNRLSFLYNSSAFPRSLFVSFRFDCVLSWNFIPSTIFTFLWQWRQNGNGDKVIHFVLNHIILIRKYFFESTYFSQFNLKSLLNQKLSSLKGKFCFCKQHVIFSNAIRLHLPPNRKRIQQK